MRIKRDMLSRSSIRKKDDQVFSKMKPYAKANHFVGMSAITRKNSLGRNLLRMRKVSFAQRIIRTVLHFHIEMREDVRGLL